MILQRLKPPPMPAARLRVPLPAMASSALGLVRMARAVAALLLVLGLALPWLLAARRPGARRWLARTGWRVLLRGFGVTVRCHGDPLPGAVLAANHVSWLDIAVLGLAVDAGFVAKADVARWPVIGALSRHYGCHFVERGQRLSATAQARDLRQRLAAGRSLILFPEGTTSDGAGVLPFRSSLFEVAAPDGEARVQPVAVVYAGRRGEALDPAGRRRIAWLGDDALLPHALALAAAGGASVAVWFEPPLAPAPRKQLAERSRAIIAARLASGPAGDQAAEMLKRAA